ncbi:MAG: hypothetical protein ABSC06_20975 [Rhodopila sp.]|jgi:hypothetical protein
MDNVTASSEIKAASLNQALRRKSDELPAWETPKLEDVSEQVMAQPYIRFT